MDAVETLHTSQRLFARALYLYPRGFRQAYGEQVAQVFGDCSREALAAGGRRQLLGLWLATLPDLLKTAVQEHLKELHMNKLLSDPKLRTQVAFILCLPFVIGQLLGLAGIDQSLLPGLFNSAGFGVALIVMMLVGLWLFGAPAGLSALFGLLSTLPFAIMELVNRREYGEPFPYPLFIGLWLIGTILSATIIPTVKDLRGGQTTGRNRSTLLLRGVILVLVAAGWISLVADQMPCFLGVRYCD